MSGEMKKDFLTPFEVEQEFGIPRGTQANWRSQRRGPRYFRISHKKIMLRRADVIEFMTSNPVLTVDSLPKKQYTEIDGR